VQGNKKKNLASHAAELRAKGEELAAKALEDEIEGKKKEDNVSSFLKEKDDDGEDLNPFE
jgi:hypothetical protein